MPLFRLLLLLLVMLSGTVTFASPDSFAVPHTLEGRVNFWVDVFAKYGKYQMVVHHREYPAAIFGVIDFKEQGETLPPPLYKRFRDLKEKQTIAYYREIFVRLASGASPSGEDENRVYEAMKLVPGGGERFQRTLKEDLIRTQTGIREKYADAMARSGRYMHMIEKVFRSHGLPLELTMLPFIESSFDYSAYSSVGAAGIWQFMPKTGRVFGLRIDKYIDERRDPLAATRAAAKYLSRAHKELGNWPLAVTSYNHGVAGVFKAVRAVGSYDIATIIDHPTVKKFGFASSNFYPELLAAIKVYNNKKEYFPEVQIEAPIHFEEIIMPQSLPAAYVAGELGVEADELKLLNRAISESVWKGNLRIPSGYGLKVPIGVGHLAVRLRKGGATTTKVVVPKGASVVYGGVSYKVRKGDTLLSISKKFGVTVMHLKESNNLSSDAIKPGMVLRIEKQSHKSDKKTSAFQKTTELSGTHTVTRGDTLGSIAKAYNCPIKQLRSINDLPSTKIQVGQILRLC